MSNTTIDTKSDSKGYSSSKRFWRAPRYDISESDDSFEVQVVMPGANRESVEISIEGDTLTVVGHRVQTAPDGWKALRRELPEGDYRLQLRINVELDEQKITAKVEDGILNLALPKAEAVKPRTIAIE